MSSSERPVGIQPWLVFGTSALFSIDKFFLIVFPSVIVDDLTQTFDIQPVDVASLLSVLLLTLLLTKMPAGYLVNHLGPRLALTIAATICAGGLILFAAADTFAVAMLARILIGFGAAFSFVCSATLAANWLPRHLFTVALGGVQAGTMVVTIVGSLLFAHLVVELGWRQAVMVLGVGNAGLAVLLWLVVRDAPTADHSFHSDVEPAVPRKHATLLDLLPIIRSPQAWLQGLYEACAYGPIIAVTGLWEISQLRARYNLSLSAATALDDLVYVGFGFGAPILGLLAARLHRRRAIMIVAGAMLAVGYLIPVVWPTFSPLLDSLRLFVIGFFASSNILAFATAKDSFPARVKELVIVFVDLVGNVGTMILPLIIGWLLMWGHSGHSGGYSADDYAFALNAVLPICGVVALLAALCTRETSRPPAADPLSEGRP